MKTYSVNKNIRFEDFLSLRGAQIKGKYIAAVCPFHKDNSPSLLVYRDGFFHCLGASCGAAGPWIKLWNKMQGQPIKLARENRVHYKSPAYLGNHSSREEQAYEAHLFITKFPSFAWYFEMRGLEDVIERHEIGYVEGWYTIPVKDREGQYVTTVYRAAPHTQEGLPDHPRYWCGSRPSPFVPDWRLLEKSEYICVVYGMLDALTLDQDRLPVMTTTAGANTFKADWLDTYRKPIYVIPDKGEEMEAIKLAGKLGIRGHVVYLDFPEGFKDCNDFVKAGKRKELLAQLSRKIKQMRG